MKSKELLRSEIKSTLSCLDYFEVKRRSDKIRNTLLQQDIIQKAHSVCIYVSKDHEVFTHNLIIDFLKNKNVYVPYISDNQMKIGQIDDFSELKEGNFNILEPIKKKEFNGKLDLLIIPGIAFDKKGNRLGRGKGFYDSFLENSQTIKIGLAFDEQILESIPVESHDIPMDLIITDQQIIEGGR